MLRTAATALFPNLNLYRIIMRFTDTHIGVQRIILRVYTTSQNLLKKLPS